MQRYLKSLCYLLALLALDVYAGLGAPRGYRTATHDDVRASRVWQEVYTAEPRQMPNQEMCSELLKQSEILENNKFESGRGLPEYRAILGTRFANDLNRLDFEDTLMDPGAGQAGMLIQYATSESAIVRTPLNKRAQVIAIAIRRPGPFLTEEEQRLQAAGRMQYHEGRAVEEYSNQDFRVQLLAEVYGGVFYTANLGTVLERYLNWAAIGRPIHVGGDLTKTRIFRKSTSGQWQSFDIGEWLADIGGAQIEVSFTRNSFRAVQKRSIQLPVLVPTYFRADRPPVRHFVEISDSVGVESK